ncbi:DUF192 domain-containing protein [Cardiobacterium hominis]|uniref:DUF192 domain-containing protein n=1 Tax=Cardiobacterium hominis TaxID=2718 RepID=UPI0028D0562F|nr:DUF192 domain-containing protein [Cardiobacterium hominis]
MTTTKPIPTTTALPSPSQEALTSTADSHRTANHRVRLGAPPPKTATALPPPLQSGRGLGRGCKKPAQRQTLTTIAQKTTHLLILTALTALPARAAEYLWLYDGERPIHAEVVYRDEDRARGLMYRPWLAPYSGMLFIFDPPQPVAFWMKNTLIPLEMRFYDAHGQRIARHLATPCTHAPCKHYPAHGQTAYVLETRARYRLVAPPYPLQILPALPQ